MESNTQKVTTRAALKLAQDVNTAQKENSDSDTEEEMPSVQNVENSNKRKVRFFDDDQINKITNI